jgi:alpha-L-rhamnosidase
MKHFSGKIFSKRFCSLKRLASWLSMMAVSLAAAPSRDLAPAGPESATKLKAGVHSREAEPQLQRSFVWLSSAPVGKQVYAAFRKPFELPNTPQAATLQLFADSRYMLWINGHYVERGPCRFDPIAPEYDTLDVRSYLKPGTNVITVLVHHYHDGKSSTDWVSINGRIMRHAPGLTAQLKVQNGDGQTTVLQTDDTWRSSTRTRFLPSPTDRGENTWASIPDRIDARRDTGDWTQPQFDDSSWEKPVSVNGNLWGSLRPRGIPRLRESEVGPLTLLEHSREQPGGQAAVETPRPLAAALPLALNAGDQLVVDAGEFAQAYSVLDFEAEEGSELELEYAQRYFETGRKPSGSYGRVNRYIARTGRQSYMSGDTFGFKYLVVRLKSGQARLHAVRLVNRLYPFDVAGSFHCNDELLTQLWGNCVHTIRLCSEDAYVDCATRERTEWMADGYVVAYRTTRVALAGPAPGGSDWYSDPRLLRNLLRHIGQSLQPDGRLKAHHPSDRWDIHGYIEDYSCLWVQGLREYVDHTGDLELPRELWPALTAQLQWFLDRRTTNGLVKAREFVYPGCNPLCYKVCEGTTLNAYSVRALRDAAYLADKIGRTAQAQTYTKAAGELAEAINRELWDDRAGAYRGGIMDGQAQAPTVPAAFMSLYFDIVPATRLDGVNRWLLDHHREQGGLPYAYHFLFEVLYRMDTAEADRLVLSLIRKRWAGMARGETSTVWEGFGPGENCHEAGAVPAYFLSAYVLGVRLDGPATTRRLLIQARLGDLKEAGGTVVTELGLAPVHWRRESPEGPLEFEIEIPQETRATLSLPFVGIDPVVILDGRTLSERQIRIRGRYAIVEIGPGGHRGRLTISSPAQR